MPASFKNYYMNKEQLHSEFEDCFETATRASEGGYGADTTDQSRLWKEFNPKLDQFVKDRVIAFGNYLRNLTIGELVRYDVQQHYDRFLKK
jgi:hypothetical protein